MGTMYQVPVLVQVSLDERKVVAVIVLDEDVRLSESETGYPEENEPTGAEPETLARDDAAFVAARDIAESTVWPAWEIGL